MIKSVIAALIMLSVFTACTTGPTQQEPLQPSIVIDDTVIDSSLLFAEQAYVNDNQLYIQFRHLSDTINSFATLPAPQKTPASSSSKSLSLQQLVELYNDLPLAQLSYIDPEQWIEHTDELQALPVVGVALWREFQDRLFASVTPRKQNKGIVVEFLKQEELFYYYDKHGLLQSVPVNHKPAHIRTTDTYKFSELLADATALIGEYISALGDVGAPALLFNTGDNAAFGYPFIYANQETGQIVFLRRLPENLECCDPSSTLLPDVLIHTTKSHLGCLLTQPIGSLTRLFTLVSFKVVDTVTPKPLVLLKDQPVPPVSDNEPMDLVTWEQELSELAYSPLSQGSIEYLVDGAAFFNRLIDVIQSAEKSIDIRLYIFDNDDYALKIADLLKQRSNEVRVRVLIDGLGSIGAASVHSPSMPQTHEPSAGIIEYLESGSNIKVRKVLNPWLTGDHTKTILIDNRVAFLGA